MALTVQNLRAVGTGVEPASLLPGQIAFNITDKVIYVGDGSNFKTDFLGNQVVGVPGNGWYAMPMDFDSLGDYYVANPGIYGDVPTDQQVLTWSTALNHPIWTSGAGGGGNQIYVVTNAQVAAAPGATTSAKISAAIGVASPDEGNVTIVTGLPDDVYEGLYFFTTEWVKGAAYAYPSASEVIYDNTAHPTLTPTVQGAIDDLDDGLIATTAIANTANSTATSALAIASAALPRAGGTMTGTLNIDAATSISFAGGVQGNIRGINDSINAPFSNIAASGTAVKTAYDIGAAALPRAGGTMTGAITFVAGQVFPVSGIQDATTVQKGVVQVGANIQVAAGVISVLDSSVSNKGVVQLYDGVNSTSPTLALTANQGSILQGQIDSLTLASNVTLAGSLDAFSGLVDSITTAGAGTVPPFAAGAVLPSPQVSLADYYVLVTTAGSYSPPGGGGPYLAEPGDWILCGETFSGSGIYVWQYLGVGARPQPATYATAGIVQLADTTVTYTGTSDTEAVTPQSLQDKLSDSTSLADSNRIASSTAVKAAYDIGAAAIPCATITAVGDIVVGGAGPAPVALPVGTTGQILMANSACATGLEWVNDTPGDVTSVTGTAPITVDNTDAQNPIVGIDAASTTQAGAVQLNDTVTSTSTTEAATANAAKTAYDKGVSACTIAQAAIPCASFLATGNLLAGTGAGTYSALTVGSNGQVLLANSACSTGLEWGNADYVPDACFTAAGDIIVGTGSTTYAALSVGTDGSVVVADSTCTEGVRWAVCPGLGLLGVTCGSGQAPFTTAFGFEAGDSALSTGFYNVSVGYQAGTNVTSGDYNVALGSFANSGNGSNNTAVGHGAYGNTSSSGLNNVAVGYQSLDASTTASNNTAVGSSALSAATTGANNTAVGFNAGTLITTGPRNTLVGYRAGALLTTGVENTIVGAFEATGTLSCNVVLANGNGDVRFQANNAGAWSPNGTNYGTIGQVLTSNGTVAAPTWSDIPPTVTGYTDAATPFNTALGTNAGDSITTGTNNASLGYNAGTGVTTGSFNVTFGSGAGTGITTQDGHVAIGYQTLVGTLDVNNLNLVAIGTCALRAVTTGQNNIGIGFCAGALITTGGCNIAIGARALDSVTSSANNIGIGFNALTSITSGSENLAIGTFAGDAITTGADNIAIGYNAGTAQAAGAQSVFIGTGAGQSSDATGVTAIGFCAAQANTTAGCGTYLGYVSGRNATGLSNTYIGALTGCAASNTSACGTLLGFCAGAALTTGNANTFLGFNSGRSSTTGTFNVAVGAAAFQSGTGSCNIAIGCGALAASASGTANVAIGHRAMLNATSAANNIAIGLESGVQLSTGSNNTFVGFSTGDTVTTGTQNTFLGACSGGAVATNSEGNTAVGFGAGGTGTLGGGYNTVLGHSAGQAITAGGGNTFVGYQSGASVTTGIHNTFLGRYLGTAAMSNNVVLADGAGNIKLQVNQNGAVGVGTTPSYGTAGQILSSAGTGAASAWTSSLPQVTAPTASTDGGAEGQIASNSTYFFMYTGGRWQRIAWDATVW